MDRWRLCDKVHLRSCKFPSKLLSCVGFLYKVVQKFGLFSQFVSQFSLTFEQLKTLSWNLATFLPIIFFSNTLLANFVIFFRSKDIHRSVPKIGQIWHWDMFLKVDRTSWASQPERKPKWRPFFMETSAFSESLAARSTCSRKTLTLTETPKLVKGFSSRSVDGQTLTSLSQDVLVWTFHSVVSP